MVASPPPAPLPTDVTVRLQGGGADLAAPSCAAAEPDLPGGARYAWVAPIATGGMGEVRRARDLALGREVAIKLLRSDAAPADARSRFVAESRLMGGLEHPSIPPVHEAGVGDDGRPYYVMRLLEGETLAELIARLAEGDREAHRAYPIHRRVRIVQQLIAVLGFAHARGVLHRDVKPANIVLGRHDEVFLLDWGIATRIASAAPEPEGTVIGTPRYMAPEALAGRTRELGPAADVFSLCVVFYELLALAHPLGRDGPSDPDGLRAAWEARAPREASEHRVRHQDRISRELALVIQAGLSVAPERRPASMQELERSLSRVLEGRNPVRCGQTGLKRAVHAFGRFVDAHHRLAAWLVVGVGLLAAYGLAAALSLALPL